MKSLSLKSLYFRAAVGAACCLLFMSPASFAESFMLFDFTEGGHGWTGNPRVSDLSITDEGLAFRSTGVDPWIEGPPINNPLLTGVVRLHIRMQSTGDGSGEVFYGHTFTAEKSRPFMVNADGEWHEYSVVIQGFEPGFRLRIDPAHETGTFVISHISAETLTPLAAPAFNPPSIFPLDEGAWVRTEEITFLQTNASWGAYAIFVQDVPMAMGHVHSELGVVINGNPVLLPLDEMELTLHEDDHSLRAVATTRDAEGGGYTFIRTVEPHEDPGVLRILLTVEADRDRDIFHLPWVTLFPGLGTFGERKTQALLPGVEYLEDEPSSSEADFNAEQAERRIVEDHKLTLPMMALQHDGRYMALAWNRSAQPAALFDSPDRVFQSGAHLMGLWHPGVGELRLENAFSAMDAFKLKKHEPLQFEVLLLGGEGASVVSAVQKYVALQGLPGLPSFEGGLAHAVKLLSAGWLDSDLQEDGLWRHALWGDAFGPVAAADAPFYMHWLAAHTEDKALVGRLRAASKRGLERLTPRDNYMASVGHVTSPAPILLFGSIENNIERMVTGARAQLTAFDEEGLRRYHQPDPDRPDYGRTHFADHANGYNAQVLENILIAAAFSGDKMLTEAGLRLLDLQTRHYAHTVPRGAQTWEMPLHTPDILGSARLINTYVLGYHLSGKNEYIDQARYWAWTGIPFLYLDHPADGPVGTYATIAVLGATNWIAPNWIGLPVQWCGLVYASALHALAQVDLEQHDFWEQTAKGITLSGLQQTFSLDDEKRRGLLPDFFYLWEQYKDGPAINPGTVQAHVPEIYGKPPFYTVRRLGFDNMLIHAPAGIEPPHIENGAAIMNIRAWAEEPYWIRITHASEALQLEWRTGELPEKHIDARHNAVNVLVQGDGVLSVRPE